MCMCVPVTFLNNVMTCTLELKANPELIPYGVFYFHQQR